MLFLTCRAVHTRIALFALALLGPRFVLITDAQRPPAQPNAAEILHKMQKLNVLGSVLYIVAHPDDENTRLITWLANGKKVRTGNLSLTRGDGGQNLIGPELGDALGIIRTQELMEARRIDGGEQFFTRAVDFGFSKNAKESFEKWGHDEVLSDVVRVIRTFRPDIIITRFPPTREAGHGHHEASAILAEEAFKLAGDKSAFPEQLTQGLEVWQPRRLFFNGSTWWKKNLAEIAKPDSGWYTVDVGGYDPLLGLSYTEIAGRSRSLHKSQGFGAAETRGEMLEYLKLIAGDKPKTSDIFEGIDMTWGRVKGGTVIEELLRKTHAKFDSERPEKSISELLGIAEQQRILKIADRDRGLLPLLDHHHLLTYNIIHGCSGTAVELLCDEPRVAVSDSIPLRFVSTQRRPFEMNHIALVANGSWMETIAQNSKSSNMDQRKKVPSQKETIEPYWLRNQHTNLYRPEGDWGFAPEYRSPLTASLFVSADTSVGNIWVTVPVVNKWVDRVAGERIRPVYVTPVASVIPQNDQLLVRNSIGEGTVVEDVVVEVEALTDSLTGQLNVELPGEWSTTKDLKLVNIAKRGERQAFTFKFMHEDHWQKDEAVSILKFTFTGPKGSADRTLHEIDYPHIMPQVYYTPASVKLIRADARATAKTVGYIKGAGDEVPQAIEQLGVHVEMIDPSTATLQDLAKYDAIVTGIRAYNTVEAMKTLNATLMKYVEQGGTLVCQYNTRSSDMVLPDSLFGPYPFKLTRDRVTVEEAPPTFLAKDHPLLNTPNKITAADFDGWVQERGLYFCGSLDPHYTPLIAWNDPGEQPLNGGLITCDYGKGRYVYTGISFFRELPAGVPGAYRLFANLISKRE